jgi:hypothetical protein
MESTSNKISKKTDDETAPEALRTASTSLQGNYGGVSKETPITRALPTYGFQNTHTTTLAYRAYYTARNLTYTADKNVLTLRLNNPGSDPKSFGGTATIGADVGMSESIRSFDSDDGITGQFPIEPSLTNGNPSWSYWAAWSKMYQQYTVLQTYYTITIHNPRTSATSGAVIVTHEQSRTSGDNDENRTLVNGNLYQYLGLEHHKKYNIGNHHTMNDTIVISGSYWPGKFKRNVVNDSDVKTWTSTTSPAAPDLIDEIFIGFFCDPLRANAVKQHLNISVEMKMNVQFKDLKEAFRYPAGQQTTISVIAPTNLKHYTRLNSAFFNTTVL